MVADTEWRTLELLTRFFDGSEFLTSSKNFVFVLVVLFQAYRTLASQAPFTLDSNALIRGVFWGVLMAVITMCCWCHRPLVRRSSDSFFRRNSFVNSLVQTLDTDPASGVFKPLNHTLGFSERCNHSIRSFVSVLHRVICKNAVSWFVVSVVVSTFYGQTFFVTADSPRLKSAETVSPFRANGYSSTAIPRIGFSSGVVTTPNHATPNFVKWIVSQSDSDKSSASHHPGLCLIPTSGRTIFTPIFCGKTSATYRALFDDRHVSPSRDSDLGLGEPTSEVSWYSDSGATRFLSPGNYPIEQRGAAWL